jgi:RNA polymerase sigma-70 factor, ECF subfamily
MSSMGETIEPMPRGLAEPTLVLGASLEDQLAAFFASHYDRMIRLAALVCHGGTEAEDAVQSAMEQAWKRRASLRDPQRLRWWLDRIVVRESIRLNRRSSWTRLTSTSESDEARLLRAPAEDSTPDRLALRDAFAMLSPEQRATCVLHLHLGYEVAETAALMGTGVETTRSRLRLARQRLRAALTEKDR